MAKGPTYAVTIELSEMELALLYHTVMQDPGEYRTVYWKEAGRLDRHYVHPHWLENKVFGCIAETQPEWLAVIDEAQKRLSAQAK